MKTEPTILSILPSLSPFSVIVHSSNVQFMSDSFKMLYSWESPQSASWLIINIFMTLLIKKRVQSRFFITMFDHSYAETATSSVCAVCPFTIQYIID